MPFCHSETQVKTDSTPVGSIFRNMGMLATCTGLARALGIFTFFMIKRSSKKVTNSCFGGSNGIQADRIGENLSFADLAVSKSQERNRSLKIMERKLIL